MSEKSYITKFYDKRSKSSLISNSSTFFPSYRDLRRDDYIIESMHNIDSNQMKYPSERDRKWARDGIFIIFFKIFLFLKITIS
jgi:hypothetical protein